MFFKILKIIFFRLLFFVLLAWTFPRNVLSQESSESIVVLEDFEENSAGNSPIISHWRWTKEQKESATRSTSVARQPIPGATKNGIKVIVGEKLPNEPQWLTIWHTPIDYLPPEARKVRFRAKVVSGSFTLTCGSATTYFACSDVWTKPRTLLPGDWQTIELSLVDGLERNFRRAVFSSASPVIHYTRWIQEPLRIMMDSSSQGELWIDDVTLLCSAPLPVTSQTPEILSKANLAQAFTFATDDKEFDLANGEKTQAIRKPAVLEFSEEGLCARQRGLEEMSFVGIPLTVPNGANALRFRGRVVHESNRPFVVVDFLALVAQENQAPALTQTRGGKGFDLCLTPKRTTGLSWGFYHARRRVPNNQEVTWDLPLLDFVCAYGQGNLRPDHQLQLPLKPSEMVALSFTSPFGQRSADTVFHIHSLESVILTPTPMPTYPQSGTTLSER